MDTNTANKEAKPPTMAVAARQGTVIVKVGPEGEEFHLHKALLMHHSEYFYKALTGPWKEAQEGVITIDDIEPGIFELFVHWLYEQNLCQYWDSRMPERTEDEPECLATRIVIYCIKAYALGLRFFVPTFCRLTHNNMSTHLSLVEFTDTYAREAICFAFENIPANRLILERLVEGYCRDFWPTRSDFTTACMSELPPIFVKRVLARFCFRVDMIEDGTQRKRECFFEHRNDEEKARCKRSHMVYLEDADVAVFT